MNHPHGSGLAAPYKTVNASPTEDSVDTIGQIQNITNGPSKFDLMACLFQAGSNSRILLTFTVQDGTTFLVALNSVQREDGSGESWNLQGYILGMTSPKAQYMPRSGEFTAYFSTKTRRGTFTVSVWRRYTA